MEGVDIADPKERTKCTSRLTRSAVCISTQARSLSFDIRLPRAMGFGCPLLGR